MKTSSSPLWNVPLKLLLLAFLSSGCSSAGAAGDRLARLQQEIRSIEAEAEAHEEATQAGGSPDALAEIEAKHRDRLEAIAAELEQSLQELDACGFDACCSSSLAGVAVSRDGLRLGIAEHHAAVESAASTLDRSMVETDHSRALAEIAGGLRGHHATMSSAGMCCHCTEMHGN